MSSQNSTQGGVGNVVNDVNQVLEDSSKRNFFVFIIVALILIVGLVFVGYKFSGNKTKVLNVKDVPQKMLTISGKVTREFEGSNELSYVFDIPDYATSTVSSDGNLIKISDATSTRVTVYFTYEGGRGLTPREYISEIIAPHVSVVEETGTTTMGNYEWQMAETSGSNWHIASLKNGEWIVAIESKKVWSVEADKLVNSFSTE